MNLKTYFFLPFAIFSAAFFLPSCNSTNGTSLGTEVEKGAIVLENESYSPGEKFNKYWYAGEAELNSYDLKQARYGEMREGTAALVFISEDFSKEALTKHDGGAGTKVPVLKVNFDKKFITGIYPYSMILSVATAVDLGKFPHALKIATSVQEWCGHTYTQIKLQGNKYQFTEHSYFPGEGDQAHKLDVMLTEDELWTRIRIAPENLPLGQVEMLPGSFYSRLKHVPLKAEKANLSLEDSGSGFKVYTISYADGSHDLKITFASEFPYIIEGWEESYMSGSGENAKRMTTTAKRKKTMKLDYWNRHQNVDLPLRTELGL